MEREITTLPRIEVKSAIPCMTPDPETAYARESDPAIRVMTDFRQVVPITIEPIVSIDLALRKMKAVGVRLLLVTDEQDNISGVISAYDIRGEQPVKFSQEYHISHDEIRVKMMMTPLHQVPSFDYNFVRQSLVRHIITTIRELERPHALVIKTDANTGRQKIRGMFSSSHISKLLGRVVYEPLRAADSLADMQHELESTG